MDWAEHNDPGCIIEGLELGLRGGRTIEGEGKGILWLWECAWPLTIPW